MNSTVRYLGSLPHPAFGIRLPDLVLPGILRSLKKFRVAGGFMLSFGRETAPRRIIEAPLGAYEITMGHTGTSIEEYIRKASEAASKEGVIAEIEADHLIIGATTAEAVSRIIGARRISEVKSETVEASLRYNFEAVDEAVETSTINAFTVDPCSLINFEADKLTREDLRYRFEELVPEENERAKILERYRGKTFKLPSADGKLYEARYTEEDVQRLTVKYRESLEAALKLYRYIEEKMNGKPFGFEIAFDETPQKTEVKDLHFYLAEWREMGGHVEFIAPNIGFEKRMNYTGSLEELRSRVSKLSAAANSMGALISIHSTSGFTPYEGKGPGVYETLRKATGGRIKTKISGIYYELLLHLLYESPLESRRRRLYEEIFDEVYRYLEKEVERKGPLYTNLLESKLKAYKEEVEKRKLRERDPLSPLAKSYLFLALNLRDGKGRRYLREEILDLYREDVEFKRIYDRSVEALTDSIIEKFGFQGNMEFLT